MKPSLLNISKTMAFATAIGAASAAWATQYLGVLPGSTDFESGELDGYMTVTNEDDASVVPGSSGIAEADRPANYRYNDSTNYVLSVETSADHPVLRAISTNAVDTTSDSVYVDMLVKPSAVFAADAQPPTVGNADKLLVYFKDVETPPGTTNLSLCVYAGGYFNENNEQGEIVTNEYVLVRNGVNTIVKDNWYRLVIKAKNVNDGNPAFSIWLGGYGDNFLCKDANDNNAFFSLHVTENGGDKMISSIGFAGNGCVDDFVASTNDPGQPAELPPLPTTALHWNPNFTNVYYVINGVTNTIVDVAAGTTNIECEAGTSITLIGDTGFRTFTTTSAEDTIDLQGATTGDLSWYSAGDGTQGNPYQIPSYDALIAMQQAVATNADYRSACYVQTADIDGTGKGAFAGIGVYDATPTGGTPFTGTYDGQGYKIKNIDFTQRNYGGVFNQVNGGTIKNLTVSNITCSAFSSGEFGFAIVGNAGNGATLTNLVAEGVFASENQPATHNVAGIVIRTSAGGNGTLIKDCTNNATLYGNYTKIGGICVLTQVKVAGGVVTFDGCVNNGDIHRVGEAITTTATSPAANSANGGFGGIVAYTADDTVVINCSNSGTISVPAGSTVARVGEIIGWGSSKTLEDQGGNSGNAAKKLLGSTGATITGFQYATVDNGVATTVSGALAAGKTYLLEGNVAASATPVATLTAVGDSISFDKSLGYTFAGTVGNSGAAGIPQMTEANNVVTYTAGYFPRTATAGQDGSAANPFEIADEDDLLALQAAVANDVGRGLCYTQIADIALTDVWEGIGVKGGKDIVSQATYDNGAFTGTYDGGNHTISNFQMESGTDYGALFNSVYNATIKNLKISYKENKLTPTADETESGKTDDSTGATFVGVAKSSTLQNLTALAGTVTTVSAYKDMGGIVGYLMAGSTVESCTNELNIASTKGSRKCGGIAIITQGGSGTAVVRNCKNTGTITGGAQDGAIVGYIGTTTAIIGCENTTNAPLLTCQSGTVTVSGGTKSVANRAAFVKNGGTVVGLNFATVDGNVATFVADNALALNGEYKVMGAGATATFAFAEAGTIAFDTALATPTYAITAAEGLTLTDATSGTVKTYTATAPAPAYPTYLDGDDTAITGAYNTWKETYSADGDSSKEDQFVLNVAPATVVPDNALSITEIVQNETAGWDITVECTMFGVDLSGTVGTARVLNGYLAVSYTDDLGGTWTTENIAITASANGKVTVNVNKSGAKFMKVKLTAKAEPQN